MANWYVSSVAYTAVQTWTALTGGIATVVGTGVIVRQTSPTTGNERTFVCTTGGTTNTTEPTWNLNYGATTTDGTVVWTQHTALESLQAAGNWKAPLARLSQLPGGTNAMTGSWVTSGDTIFVSSDHAETQNASYTVGSNFANYFILSVSRNGLTLPPTSSDLTRGASVNQTGAGNTLTISSIDGYWWGIDFLNNGPITHKNAGGTCVCTYDNCSFQLTRSGNTDQLTINTNSGGGAITWNNTTFHVTNAGQQIMVSPGYFEWKNTTSAVQGTTLTSALINFGTGTAPVVCWFRGVDLGNIASVLTSGLASNNFWTGFVQFRDCKLQNAAAILRTGQTFFQAGNGFQQIMVDNCDDTTNHRNYRMVRGNAFGQTQTTTALVRQGGNTDGVTQFSWQFVSSGNNIAQLGMASRLPEIQQRYNTTGSSKTLTLYGCSSFSTIPTNAQMYIDVEYLGSTTSPIASFVSSAPTSVLTTPTNLTADTSNWTSGVAARQNSHAYNQGDLIVPVGNPTRVFVCTVAGTSAGSEPGGYASAVDGGTVTDGGATFQAMWRWSISVSFTPQMAGTVKCSPRTTLKDNTNMPTFKLLILDPAFVIV